MPRPPLPPLALALLPVLAACAGDSAASRSTARDSAGIRIVESTAPAWGEGRGWRVAAEPTLRIGESEGRAALQLDGVSGTLRLGDGRIVVANGGSHELRFFDAAGRHLASAGREGGGPGEFRALGWIGRGRADSVLAWDGRERRLSVFTPQGRFARAVSLAQGLRLFPQVAGVLDDGSVVTTPGVDFSGEAAHREGEHRDSVTYLRFAPDGRALGAVARVAGPESFRMRLDDNTMDDHVVFGRRGLLAVAGREVYVGDTDRYELVRLGEGGRPGRIVRRRHEPVAVGAADVERFHAEADARAGRSAGPPQMRAFLEKMREQRRRIPHRPTLPAFARVRADPEGNLWVEQARRPGDEPPRWDVFDHEGVWQGTVATPAGLDVHQIGADWLLGVARDEDDVQQVRLHRIEKPRQD